MPIYVAFSVNVNVSPSILPSVIFVSPVRLPFAMPVSVVPLTVNS